MRRTCGERAVYRVRRPHYAAIRDRSGAVGWRVERQVERCYRCGLEPGHEGPHYDSNNMVKWRENGQDQD